MTQFDSPDISDSSDPPTMDEVYKSARQLVLKGYTVSQIRNWLVRKGVNEQVAAEAADDVADAQPEGESIGGFSSTSHLILGIVCLAFGLLITIISYAMAAGGEVYIVAWGAMLGGVVELGLGLGSGDK